MAVLVASDINLKYDKSLRYGCPTRLPAAWMLAGPISLGVNRDPMAHQPSARVVSSKTFVSPLTNPPTTTFYNDLS